MASSPPVDEVETEQRKLIYTRIGMVMEDASTIALELGGPASKFDTGRIEQLASAIRTITTLAKAAQSIRE